MSYCYFQPSSITTGLRHSAGRSTGKFLGQERCVPFYRVAGFILFLLFLCLPLSAQIPTNGLVAQWFFSGNPLDGTANGHNGTVFGATLVADRFGDSNRAYYFDGIDDYIRIPHSPLLNFDTSFTISAWVKFCVRQPQPNSEVGPAILEKYDTVPITSSYAMVIARGNRLAAGRQIADANGVWQVGTVAMGDGEWHHIASVFRKSDTTLYLYVDGRPDVQIKGYVWWLSFPNSGDITIGNARRWQYFYNYGSFFDGAIDDITMYSRALSFSEIASLYGDRGWPGTRARPIAKVNIRSVEAAAFCPDNPSPIHLVAEGEYDMVRWSPADGLSSTTAPNPNAQPKQTTLYTVTAYKFGHDFPCPDTATKTDTIRVTVLEPPIADAGTARYVCAQDTIIIGGTTTRGATPYRWQWSPTDGLDDPTAERPRLVVTQNARYQVIVTDAKGCHDTAGATITLIPRPKVDLGRDTVYYCIGSGGVEIAAVGKEGNPPYSFSWTSTPGLTLIDSTHALAAPRTATTYSVEINDAPGLCSGYGSIVVVPVDPPVADAGGDAMICVGEKIQLRGRGTGGRGTLLYAWSPGAGLDDSTIAEPTLYPGATTRYRLRVTDSLTGCFSDDEVEVRVNNVRPRPAGMGIGFGVVDGCRIDSVAAVTLFNEGSSDGTITSWSSDQPGVSLLNGGAILPAGGKLDLQIRFAPASAGTYSGHMIVRIGPCADSVVIAFSGEKERSTVGTDLSEIDFGRQPTCRAASTDTTIVLTNSGTADVEIAAPAISPPYTLLSPSFPATLKPGDRLEILLRYEPTGAGVFDDALRIPFVSGSCSDTLRTALRGTVEQVRPEPQFSAIDFGLLDGCATEKDTVIVLDNPFSFDITMTDANLPAGFVLRDPLPIVIPSSGQTQLHIRYAPPAPGLSGGTASLRYEPCDAELQLALSGEKRGITFALPDTLDFGTLLLCEGGSKSLALPILMKSEGGENGSVSLLSISSPFTTDLPSNAPLPNGAEQIYRISFTPTAEGIVEGDLYLRLQPCGTERHIRLVGRSEEARLSGVDLDFGKVAIGSSRRGDVLFRNTGSGTLHLDRIDGILPPFRLLSATPGLPADLRPGEELRLEVEYVPVRALSTARAEAIVTDPCELTFGVELRGTGVDSAAARTTIALPTLTAAPGEGLRLDLRLTGSAGKPLPDGTPFRAEIAFDASMLTVSDDTPWRFENRERVLILKGEYHEGNDLLAEADLTAALGQAEKTPLRLVSFEWIGIIDTIVIDTVNGEFSLLGLCRDGGTRLYDPSGRIAIKSISPNPANGRARIIYTLSESGPHRLRLIDGNGRDVQQIFNGAMVPGEYALDLSLPNISSGAYYLLLETPSTMITGKMEVVR